MTHIQFMKAAKFATPCTAHHVNFGGGCLNCGWEPWMLNATNRDCLHNPNCDGSHCLRPSGEVRKLPTGGGSNAILCHACYRFEIAWRKDRNRELGDFAKFDLPAWEDLEVYPNE